MATAVNQRIVYKTNSGWVSGLVSHAYTLSGGVYTDANAVAYSDTSVDAADLVLDGNYQHTQLTKVLKCSNVGTEGAVTYAQIATMTVGTWGVVT